MTHLDPGMDRPVHIVWQQVEALDARVQAAAKHVPSYEGEQQRRDKHHQGVACKQCLPVSVSDRQCISTGGCYRKSPCRQLLCGMLYLQSPGPARPCSCAAEAEAAAHHCSEACPAHQQLGCMLLQLSSCYLSPRTQALRVHFCCHIYCPPCQLASPA